MKLSPGDMLHNYELIRLLGEGGMGEVYLARDVLLEREVAIKCLNPLLTQDSQFADRFIREARIQAQLMHSNIVSLLAFFESDGAYYMALEYARGITLRALIDRTGPIPEPRTLHIFHQILSALAYAHAKDIVHRDIKPTNIMVDTDNGDAVKVMDFGIARLMSSGSLTRTGTKLGTPKYMSPEQVRELKDVDQRSDIYSAGAVLYEMLCGRSPYNEDTDSDYEIQHRIVTEDLPDPRLIYPNISQLTVNLMRSMTVKDRDLRPQSVAELLPGTQPSREAEPLGPAPAASREQTQPRPVPIPPAPVRIPARKQSPIWLILLFMLFIGAGVGVWGWTQGWFGVPRDAMEETEGDLEEYDSGNNSTWGRESSTRDETRSDAALSDSTAVSSSTPAPDSLAPAGSYSSQKSPRANSSSPSDSL